MPSEEYFIKKRKYINKYNSKNYCSISITFRKDDPKQMEICEFLKSRYSTTQYIKDLVAEDMKKNKNK